MHTWPAGERNTASQAGRPCSRQFVPACYLRGLVNPNRMLVTFDGWERTMGTPVSVAEAIL